MQSGGIDIHSATASRNFTSYKLAPLNDSAFWTYERTPGDFPLDELRAYKHLRSSVAVKIRRMGQGLQRRRVFRLPS